MNSKTSFIVYMEGCLGGWKLGFWWWVEGVGYLVGFRRVLILILIFYVISLLWVRGGGDVLVITIFIENQKQFEGQAIMESFNGLCEILLQESAVRWFLSCQRDLMIQFSSGDLCVYGYTYENVKICQLHADLLWVSF